MNTPKTQSQCWNCGKTGHQYKDCWVNLGRWPQQQIQGHSNSHGKGSDAKNQAKVVERKENPKMLEHLYGINSRVPQRAQWHRLHHRQRQAQRLARLTRLSAQRWICAPGNCEPSVDSLQCGYWSWRNRMANERGLRV